MRILHLHETTEIKGGAEVYISQLQHLLPLYKHQTYWIGIDEYGEKYVVTDFKKGVILETALLKDVLKLLESFVRNEEIELINIHNIFNKAIVEFCFKLLPVVKSAHGPVMICPGKDKFWRYSEGTCTVKYGLHCFWHIYSEGCANRHPKRVIKAWNMVNFEVKVASKSYRNMIVMSDYIKSGLLECGIQEDKITCNPYFTPVASAYPTNDEKKKLLFVGRLISSKGPHILIKLLTPLLNQRDDVQLNIVGDGLMMAELVNIVKEAGLTNKITFYGWLDRDRINALLGECYLVLFPSIYPEAFGIVGIEAMMRAKPVVGFDSGGVSTWLKDGETGFLVDTENENAMREKIEMLLEDSELYNKMGSKARDEAMIRFTPEVHMNKLLDVYINALK